MQLDSKPIYKKIFCKRNLCILSLIVILFLTLLLTSCSNSTYIQNYNNFNFNYDASTNATEITWNLSLFNDHYLTIKSEKFYLDLYLSGTMVQNNGYITFDIVVNPGDTVNQVETFMWHGQADQAVFKSFTITEYDTLWNTYQGWFIGAIVVLVGAVIAYVITVIVTKSDLIDVWVHLQSWWYWVPPIAGVIIVLIVSGLIAPKGQYGPLIICASAVGIFIVTCLIFHFFQFIIQIIIDSLERKKVRRKFSKIDINTNDIKSIKKNDLINFCEMESIISNPKRFKYYPKSKIIDWIKKYNSGEDVELLMNQDLRKLNRNQLINYCNMLDKYWSDDMNEVEIACQICDIDYEDVNYDGIFNFFTTNELRKICEYNKIFNYKNLNREELIDLLSNCDNIHFDSENVFFDLPWFGTDFKKTNFENKNIYSSQIKEISDPKGAKIISNITFKDIAGLESVKKAFEEKVILPIKHAELFKNFKKKTGGGILLFGLPGTGKTLFAEAISNEIEAKYFSIKCSDIKSKWIGESESKIKELFENARNSERAIIFMDEFESIGRKRTNDDLESQNIVPEILAQMQGVGTNNANILVIAATNKPWDIDSALLRPGRFDEKIYVPLPDFSARKEIFKIKLKDIPIEDLDFDYLAKITKNCNGADIAYFCEKLKMSAINRSIKTNKEQKINSNDLKNVEKSFKSSVNLNDLKEMENFLKKYNSF